MNASEQSEMSAATWPLLVALENSASRTSFIGGSDANTILSGDPDRVFALWQEKRGECEPEDLSQRLPVMLGTWTEAFNRQWFEKLTGRSVCRIGKLAVSEKHPWRRCSLDGFLEDDGSVWEAKHTNAFSKPDEVLERYMPQLQHNMAVVGCERAVMSVIFGNHKFEIIEVASDWLYQRELLRAEQEFWRCVLEGVEPVAFDPPAPPRPVGIREICLQGNNHWASASADWLYHRAAAKAHATACTTIKSLVEDDVARAFGHGIEVKRSKAGALSIRELAE